jgi:hypothetical protein
LLVTYEGSQAINQSLHEKLPFDSLNCDYALDKLSSGIPGPSRARHREVEEGGKGVRSDDQLGGSGGRRSRDRAARHRTVSDKE